MPRIVRRIAVQVGTITIGRIRCGRGLTANPGLHIAADASWSRMAAMAADSKLKDPHIRGLVAVAGGRHVSPGGCSAGSRMAGQ